MTQVWQYHCEYKLKLPYRERSVMVARHIWDVEEPFKSDVFGQELASVVCGKLFKHGVTIRYASAYHYALLAQLVEHGTFNAGVRSSSLRERTNICRSSRMA